MLMPGARSVYDLNRERNVELAKVRAALWQDQALALANVRKVTGIRKLGDLPVCAIEENRNVAT